MSTIGIVTEMHYEYSGGGDANMGQRRLIICDTTPLDDPVVSERTWAEVKRNFDTTGFSCFASDWWQPSTAGGAMEDAVPYANGASFCGAKISWTDCRALLTQGVDAIRFDFTPSVDLIPRSIRCEFIYYEPTSTEHTIGFKWQFIKNGVVKLTWNSNGSSSRYYQVNNKQINVFYNYVSVPWIHFFTKSGFNTDMFGGIDLNCNYTRVRDTIYKPWYNSDADCYGLFNATLDATIVNGFYDWLGEYVPEEYDPDNPYDPGGESGEGGGDGNFSPDTDDVDPDELPDETEYSANASGFITLFNPTLIQLRNLAGLFWNATFAGAIRNFIENITDMFISLAIVPFTVPPGSNKTVTWFGISTGVELRLCGKQFYEFECGDINLANDNRIFTSGSALDYSPYSQLGIYLPFIGYRDLDVDECRDSLMNLKYRFDLLSGECVAIISVDGKAIYEFTGNCLVNIPITSQSMDSLIQAVLNVAVAGAAGAEGAVASAGDTATQAASTGNISEAYMNEHQNVVSGAADSLLSATANNAMAIKPRYSKSGSVSGAASMLSVLQPYLFLKTPRQAIPKHYERFCGFPSNISGALREFSGYTVVEDIRLNNLVATSGEIAEIYDLLKKGVII